MNKLKLRTEQLRLLKTLLGLSERYGISQDMTAQQVFDAFVMREEDTRQEFIKRSFEATTPAKQRYWSQRASGLTTAGGQSRLRKLLMLVSNKESV